MDYFELFDETMHFEELYHNSSLIDVDLPHILWTDAVKKTKNKLNEQLKLPSAFIQFYKTIELIQFSWSPSDKKEGTQLIKKDLFLKENYFDLDYDWESIREMLGGVMNVPKLEDLFNPELRKEQNHYYTMMNTEGYNPDEFVSFDLHWDLAACLKIEDNAVLDNVWLVHWRAEEVYDMKISVEKYFDLAYKSKVFYHWQIK